MANTTTTRRIRREKIVEIVAGGPEAELRRVKAAIASLKKAEIYWIGVKATVAWNVRGKTWTIRSTEPLMQPVDSVRQESQRELIRALALAFIDEGLPVSVVP